MLYSRVNGIRLSISDLKTPSVSFELIALHENRKKEAFKYSNGYNCSGVVGEGGGGGQIFGQLPFESAPAATNTSDLLHHTPPPSLPDHQYTGPLNSRI